MSKAQSIVRLETFPNRTPTGRPSATAAKKLAQYLAYGRGSQQEQAERLARGTWRDERGRRVSHQAVMDWVAAQGKDNQLTYQFILSARDVALTPAQYGQAMAAGGDLFPEWRLIRHQDAQHAHAHALAFGNKAIRIRDPEFQLWWQQVRAELEQLQKQYQQTEQAPDLNQQLDQQPAVEQLDARLGHGWGLEM